MATRLLGYLGRGLRAIGHELAETIRYGAVPAAVTAQASPRTVGTNAAAVVAALAEVSSPADRLPEPENAQPSEG